MTEPIKDAISMTDYERDYRRALYDAKMQLALCRKANDLTGRQPHRRMLFLFVNPLKIIVPCVETALE